MTAPPFAERSMRFAKMEVRCIFVKASISYPSQLSSTEMYISFNFGFVHSASIGDIGAVFDNIKLGNYNLTNRWELSEDSWNTALGRLLDKYLAMDGN